MCHSGKDNHVYRVVFTILSLTDTPVLPCMGFEEASRSKVAMSCAWRNQVLPRWDDASVPRTAKERGRSTAVPEAFFAPHKS